MRYITEKEKYKKESRIRNYPTFIKRWYYAYPTAKDLYDDLVSSYVNSDTILLDGGCGKKGIVGKYSSEVRLSAGIDISFQAIEGNDSLDVLVVGDLERLPFKNEIFHIIVCQWVGEHLEHPDIVFREFYRVLQRGGSLILITNSIYNPVMLLSKLLPLKLRDKIKKQLLPPEIEEPTFPTYYRCNSIRQLDRLSRSTGFIEELISYEGAPSFFAFSKTLLFLALLYEKLTDFEWLRPCKSRLLAFYTKKE